MLLETFRFHDVIRRTAVRYITNTTTTTLPALFII